MNAYATRKRMYRAAGLWLARRHPHRSSGPAMPLVSERETRDELIRRARRTMEEMRSKIAYGKRINHPLPNFERTRYLAEAAFLRTAALARPRADQAGRVWYVSIRDGARHGLLYGPLSTQAAALRALDLVRRTASEANHADAAFASFGTASTAEAYAKAGILNHLLPPIPAAGTASLLETAA